MNTRKSSKYKKLFDAISKEYGYKTLDYYRIDIFCLEASGFLVGLTVNFLYKYKKYYIDGSLEIIIPEIEGLFPLIGSDGYERMPMIGAYILNFTNFSNWIYSNPCRSRLDLQNKIGEYFSFAKNEIQSKGLTADILKSENPEYMGKDIRNQLITSPQARVAFDKWKIQ